MRLYKDGAVFVTATREYSKRYAKLFYTDFSDGSTKLLIPDVSRIHSYAFSYIFTNENLIVYPKINGNGLSWYIYDGKTSTEIEPQSEYDYCGEILDADTLLMYNSQTNECYKYSISKKTSSGNITMPLNNRILYNHGNEVMYAVSPDKKYFMVLTINGFQINQYRAINIYSINSNKNVRLDYFDRFPVTYADYFGGTKITWVE